MFCTKCGHERPSDAAFCTHCGTRFTAAQPVAVAASAPAMTPKEYFANHCSAITRKKRVAIKALCITSLAIQGILSALVIIALGMLASAINQSPIFRGAGSLVLLPAVFILIFTAGSFLFTILGMKKNSTGFFVGATIFAFFSTTFSAGNGFESLPLRWFVIFGTVAIYIVVTVLNSQINKEFRQYLPKKSV